MDSFKIQVEKVYSNSYYQNLLLSLPKRLRMYKHVTNIVLKRLKPQTDSYIAQWENYNVVFLPHDLRDFYLAHDGFLLAWSYCPIPNGTPIQCGVNINGLNDLDVVTGYAVTTKAGITMQDGKKILNLCVSSKVFELELINHDCSVCLVYYSVWFRPSIWLWSRKEGFFFLTNDFTGYFRMSIAHLGIVGWQYLRADMELSKWTNRIMRKMAPHLLKSKKTFMPTLTISGDVVDTDDAIEINKLDPNIFSTTTKSCANRANVPAGKNGNGNANSTAIVMWNSKKGRASSAAISSKTKHSRIRVRSQTATRNTTENNTKPQPTTPSKIPKRRRHKNSKPPYK